MFESLDISTSGMTAQRVRMTAIADNIANLNTTRTNAAGPAVPYRRLMVLMAAGGEGEGRPGVHVAGIVPDQSKALRAVPDPLHQHPDCAADGNVYYPNVDLIEENVDALEAARAFEANVSAFETTKTMISGALRILA
jgi:flagellar basal-body rod protein FlgC